MSSITTVGVVGAGTMGNGIAQACAVKGLNVVMIDIGQPQVDRGIATITKSLDKLVAKEKMSTADTFLICSMIFSPDRGLLPVKLLLCSSSGRNPLFFRPISTNAQFSPGISLSILPVRISPHCRDGSSCIYSTRTPSSVTAQNSGP